MAWIHGNQLCQKDSIIDLIFVRDGQWKAGFAFRLQ